MLDANSPQLKSVLPTLAEFINALTIEVSTGRINSWEEFSARTDAFYTPAVMQQIEVAIPGWNKMAAYAKGATLVHVTSALVALKLLPEYQRATASEQKLFEWIVLLHDIGKELIPGQRDNCHGFRSAVVAGRILPGLGFPISNEYPDVIDAWATLTNAAARPDEKNQVPIQDNRKLPEILAGIEKLFGQNSAAAIVIKAVLLHYSIDTVKEWPQVAPLSEAEIKRYIDLEFVPYLESIMLVDSDAYSLFDQDTKEEYRRETLLAFQNMRQLVASGTNNKASANIHLP